MDPKVEAPPLVVLVCVRLGGDSVMASTAAVTNLSLSVGSFGSTMGAPPTCMIATCAFWEYICFPR
jgi:hypothetical protein